MNKVVNGMIPKGYGCPYRMACGNIKHLVCNGKGCPFHIMGTVHDKDYLCLWARLVSSTRE